MEVVRCVMLFGGHSCSATNGPRITFLILFLLFVLLDCTPTIVRPTNAPLYTLLFGLLFDYKFWSLANSLQANNSTQIYQTKLDSRQHCSPLQATLYIHVPCLTKTSSTTSPMPFSSLMLPLSNPSPIAPISHLHTMPTMHQNTFPPQPDQISSPLG